MKKIVIILSIIVVFLLYYETMDKEIIIPDEAIRLRVIPNSNSSFDQNMKLKVKTYLEENVYNLIKDEESKEEAKNIIIKNIPNIEDNINNIFKDNNYDMDFNVNYGYNYFPEKEYRGVKYNSGYYESLVISIGNAEGDNWWCVLFPNLCLAYFKSSSDKEYHSWVIDTINKYFK